MMASRPGSLVLLPAGGAPWSIAPLKERVLQTLLAETRQALAESQEEPHEKLLKALALYEHDYSAQLGQAACGTTIGAGAGSAAQAAPALGQDLVLDAHAVYAAREALAERMWGKATEMIQAWLADLPQHGAAVPPALQRFAEEEGVLSLIASRTSLSAPRLGFDGGLLVALGRGDVPPQGPARALFEATLASLLSSGRLTFPFKRMFFSDEQAVAMMARLERYALEERICRDRCEPHNIRFQARGRDGRLLFPLRFEGGYLSLLFLPRDYDEMDVLVDLFQERARLSACRSDQARSPLAEWARGEVTRRVVCKVAGAGGAVGTHELREEFYRQVKECTQFKPSLATSVIRLFRARSVLDFSAGWGDRLAGAIAAGVDRYMAFDPNTALRAGHRALLEAFVPPQRRDRFQISYVGFEHAEVPAAAFDLVLTSPPFFDFEIYTGLPGQSVELYRGFDDWAVAFLFASIRRAWRGLRRGGHCVIHIADVFATKVCERMCLLVQWQLPAAVYKGVICSRAAGGTRPRPLWVFHKAAQAPADGQARADAAAAALRGLYRSTYDRALALFKEDEQAHPGGGGAWRGGSAARRPADSRLGGRPPDAWASVEPRRGGPSTTRGNEQHHKGPRDGHKKTRP